MPARSLNPWTSPNAGLFPFWCLHLLLVGYFPFRFSFSSLDWVEIWSWQNILILCFSVLSSYSRCSDLMTCCELHRVPSVRPDFTHALLWIGGRCGKHRNKGELLRWGVWNGSKCCRRTSVVQTTWLRLAYYPGSAGRAHVSGVRMCPCTLRKCVCVFPSQSSCLPLFYGCITMTLHEFMSGDKTILKLSFSIFNVIPHVVRVSPRLGPSAGVLCLRHPWHVLVSGKWDSAPLASAQRYTEELTSARRHVTAWQSEERRRVSTPQPAF